MNLSVLNLKVKFIKRANLFNFLKKNNTKKPSLIEENLKLSFNKIKEEMNDHLQAINENTSEINSTNSYVSEIEERLNKLAERLDDIEARLSELSGKKEVNETNFKDIILTPKEQEIFFILYSRTGDLLDYKEISRALGLTEQLVRKYIGSMINKGIPIIKKYFEEKVYIVLDSDFRNLQAKKNIIKLK